MFGFHKNKRIVLFDTLLEQVHNDEVLAILGHELGKQHSDRREKVFDRNCAMRGGSDDVAAAMRTFFYFPDLSERCTQQRKARCS